MQIHGIVWLEDIVLKLHAKHRVEPEEVEEVLDGRPHIRKIEAGKVRGEDLYAALGRSNAGRFLIVFFVYKESQQALVVSAREMTNKEKRLYGRS